MTNSQGPTTKTRDRRNMFVLLAIAAIVLVGAACYVIGHHVGVNSTRDDCQQALFDLNRVNGGYQARLALTEIKARSDIAGQSWEICLGQ